MRVTGSPFPTLEAKGVSSVPNVADGEHTGRAGFEQVGFPLQGPAFSQVWAGQDVAPWVAPNRLWQPFGERLRADQDEQPVGRFCLGIASVPVPESDLLQASIAVAAPHLGALASVDVG